jgi:hypothetical protein
LSFKIENYRFGHIVINGTEYTTDLKIFFNEVKPNWWRAKGHLLNVSDIEDILEQKPEIIIIGTGSAGILKVAESTIKVINKYDITLITKPTPEACDIYNELSGKNKVIAALHLTC